MKDALALLLFTSLAAYVGVHVAIVVGLARERAFGRAALAFFVLPLAPYWGWSAGMRRRSIAWGVSLAIYAAGVSLA